MRNGTRSSSNHNYNKQLRLARRRSSSINPAHRSIFASGPTFAPSSHWLQPHTPYAAASTTLLSRSQDRRHDRLNSELLQTPIYNAYTGTMSYQTSHGPVAIIPATEFRSGRTTGGAENFSRSLNRNDGGHANGSIPINAAYYLRPLGVTTHHGALASSQPDFGRIPRPTTYFPSQQTVSSYPSSTGYYPYQPPYHHAAYQPYPAPVSATPPPANGNMHKTTQRYYDKRSYYNTKAGRFGDGHSYPSSGVPSYYRHSPLGQKHTYHLYWRIAVKLAQIICGAIVIGCVSGPTRGLVLHEFAYATKTEGQIAVVIIAAAMLVSALIFLVTVKQSAARHGWRIADVINSACSCLLYIIIASVEAWYAACYPPYGQRYPQACRLPEWSVATIFGFFAMFLYAMDFFFALQGPLIAWLL